MKNFGLTKKLLVVAFIPLMLFISLVSWGLSSAVGSSPDDDYHMASIWCGQGLREGLCEVGAEESERSVPRVLNERSSCYAHDPNKSAACAVAPYDDFVSTDRGNFTGGYPPVFYAVMSIFAQSSVSAAIFQMRVANAFIFVTLMSVLFFLLPRSRRDPLALGALVSLVPLGMFLIPSTNPSSWAVMSAATLWVAVLAFFEASSRKKRVIFGVIALVSTVLGAGARSDAAVYGSIAMMAAMVLSFEKTRRYFASCLLPIGLLVISVLLFLSAGQSAVLTPDALDTGMTQQEMLSLLILDLQLLPELWIGALGSWGLGWLDTAMPGLVWVTSVAVFSSLIFSGLRTAPPRKAMAFAGVFVSLVVIPMYILVNDGVVVGGYVQPRYIYPLMILLAGVALLQLNRRNLVFSTLQMYAVAAVLSVANGTALHINIRRYISGVDVGGFNLSAAPEWWWNIPIGPMEVWAVGTFSFAFALFAFATYLVRPRRSSRAAPDLTYFAR